MGLLDSCLERRIAPFYASAPMPVLQNDLLLMLITCGILHYEVLASKCMHHFAPHLMFTYVTSQFIIVGKITYFHIAMLISRPFYSIFIQQNNGISMH